MARLKLREFIFLFAAMASTSAQATCRPGDNLMYGGDSVRARELLFNQHQCDPNLIRFVRSEYNFKWLHWAVLRGGWGWDACSADDSQFEFPRIIDAAYVLKNAIVQPAFGGFHNASDYAGLPNGDTKGLGGYRHQPQFGDAPTMRAYGGAFNTDRVKIYCPGFNSNPITIASNLIHESEHFFLGNWKGTKAHKTIETSTPGITREVDEWFDHPSNPSTQYEIESKHSMYQIQAEFYCDLANFPADWVSLEMMEKAATSANSVLTNNIVNPPGWLCSVPRPLPFPFAIKIQLGAEEVGRF